MDTVAAAFGSLGTLSGEAYPRVAQLVEKVLDYARVAGGDGVAASESFGKFLGANSLAIEEQDRLLDLMTATSQETGISADDLTMQLVEQGKVWGGLGLSVEEQVVLMGMASQKGVKLKTLNTVLKQLFDNTGDALGGLRSVLDEAAALPEEMRTNFLLGLGIEGRGIAAPAGARRRRRGRRRRAEAGGQPRRAPHRRRGGVHRPRKSWRSR